MKKLIRDLIGLVSLIAIPMSWAGDLSIPNSFTSGTPAVAAQVNDNFSAVEQEVDDNNARINLNAGTLGSHNNSIDAIQNQTQNLETGCPAGESIAAIAADGMVTCQPDTNTTYSAGSGLILNDTTFSLDTTPSTYEKYYSGASFLAATGTNATDPITLRRNIVGGYMWSTLSARQYLFKEVSLPDGAQLTDITCYFYDDDAAIDLQFYADFRELSAGAIGPTARFPINSSSSGQSTTMYSPNTAANLVVDNANAYYFYVHSSSFSGSQDVRFYGCKLTYNK